MPWCSICGEAFLSERPLVCSRKNCPQRKTNGEARGAVKDVPLEQWPLGWLAMECASLLDDPLYIVMHEHERRSRNLPATEQEMRAFISEQMTSRREP